MSACSPDEIVSVKRPGQHVYWQIYAANDLEMTKKEVEKAILLGFTGIALTVDAIRAGKRERDARAIIMEAIVSFTI